VASPTERRSIRGTIDRSPVIPKSTSVKSVESDGTVVRRGGAPSSTVGVLSVLDETNVNIYPGKATTYAGNGTNATVDGTGTSASFKDMGGVEVVQDGSGNPFAYVATTGSIRKVNLQTAQVSTLTGSGRRPAALTRRIPPRSGWTLPTTSPPTAPTSTPAAATTW
jgi:hypothetical protein